jgi:hypothetical protein
VLTKGTKKEGERERREREKERERRERVGGNCEYFSTCILPFYFSIHIQDELTVPGNLWRPVTDMGQGGGVYLSVSILKQGFSGC